MLRHLYDITPYILNPLAIQTLVVALALSYLGIYGLIREQSSHVSVVFFVLTLCLGVWLFAFSWMYSAIDVNLAMWWAKVGYVGIAFIPAAVYHFSALILQKFEKVRKQILAAWMLSFLFMLLILTTDIQFGSLYHYPWGFYPKSAVTSIPFLFYFFGVMLTAMRGLVAGFRTAVKGSARAKRAGTALLAFAAGYFAIVDFIASFGVNWHPVGYLSIVFFIAISARSIRHYRFMGITPAFAAPQIIDTMNDALIVFDPDGVVRLVNQATCRLFGCGERDLVDKRLTESMIDDIVFAEKFESIIRNGTVRNVEVDYRTKENGLLAFRLSTSMMRNPSGEALATVCVLGDITDRREAEEEREKLITQLREAYEKLQEVDKMKSDFVSVVSHELRSPLTTIKAYAELIIMKPNMSQERKAAIMNTINFETDRLTRLISDFLDLARIEAGSMKWRATDVSIEDVIRSAVTSMEPIFEKKGLQLTTAFNSPLSSISADRDRLVQVVTNLLSNAVKFTPMGGTVHVAARQETAPREQIAVEISDTGRGIPAGDLELIFEKFHRSRDELSTTIEGTGLGLAIARQIVEYHGGRIWAASTPGNGSVFTFTLPLPRKEVSSAPSQP